MRNRNIIGTKEAITNSIVAVANFVRSGLNTLRIDSKLNDNPPDSFSNGIDFQITSAGSAAQDQNGLRIDLVAGYTGGNPTRAILLLNRAAGTGANLSAGQANFGITSDTTATTTGTNIGLSASARGGNINYGLVGGAITTKNGATNIGGFFFAGNSGTTPSFVAVYGTLGAEPALSSYSSAATFDNGGTTAFILDCLDNGSTVFRINDGGGIQVKSASLGSVTLDNSNHVIRCDASAGAIILTLPAIAAGNRGIWYRVKKIDATANTVTIARTGADTIDGAVSKILASQYDTVDVICPNAGTDWALFGVSSGGVGPTGPTGPQGQIGQTGEEGPEGSQGPPGIQGPTGSIGLTGNNGFDGRPGYDGNDGDDGRMGVPGNDGVAGAIGPQGIQGIPGPQGEDGEDGQIGPIGPQGIQGPAGSGGGTFGQASVDFGTFPALSSVTVAVADAGVLAASRILCSIVPGTGRDLDELELSSVLVSPGDIVAGVGFNLIAVAPNDDADGAFLINYTRN